MVNIDNLNVFRNNGIIKLENFISAKEILYFRKKVSNLGKPNKGEKKSVIYSEKMGFSEKIKNILEIYIYKKFASKKKFQIFADCALEKKTKLYNVDTYYSQKTDEPILDWHFDQAYSGRENIKENDILNPDKAALKFFIYLSDTYKDNGCLSYIKGSNKVAYALKKLIYEKDIKYEPYWKLEQFEKIIIKKDNMKKIINILDKNIIEEFLHNVKILKSNNYESAEYDYNCKQGDMLIFDEAGCHRGSKLLFSDRYVMRFFFKRA